LRAVLAVLGAHGVKEAREGFFPTAIVLNTRDRISAIAEPSRVSLFVDALNEGRLDTGTLLFTAALRMALGKSQAEDHSTAKQVEGARAARAARLAKRREII